MLDILFAFGLEKVIVGPLRTNEDGSSLRALTGWRYNWKSNIKLSAVECSGILMLKLFGADPSGHAGYLRNFSDADAAYPRRRRLGQHGRRKVQLRCAATVPSLSHVTTALNWKVKECLRKAGHSGRLYEQLHLRGRLPVSAQ